MKKIIPLIQNKMSNFSRGWHTATLKSCKVHVLEKKICKLSGRLVLTDTFYSLCREWKPWGGVGENCAHSAGSVTWGLGSSHHSCSTPTYRHTARNIKYARRATVRANFGKTFQPCVAAIRTSICIWERLRILHSRFVQWSIKILDDGWMSVWHGDLFLRY